MSAFSGQQFSNLQLQNIFKNAAANAQQGANKAGGNLMAIYNRYLRPAPPAQGPVQWQGPVQDQMNATGNAQGSIAGYPNQPSDEDQSSVLDSGVPPESMATGRLVTKPTYALLGERGPERVIALNANPYNKTNMPGWYRGGSY